MANTTSRRARLAKFPGNFSAPLLVSACLRLLITLRLAFHDARGWNRAGNALVALDEKREIHMVDAYGHGKDTDRALRRLVVDRIVSSAHLLPRLAEPRFVG